VADPVLLGQHGGIPSRIQYGGKVIQSSCVAQNVAKFARASNRANTRVDATYCAGPVYFLRARAIEVLAAHMDSCTSKFEDVAVGITLTTHGVNAEALQLYTDEEREFDGGMVVAWHDSRHVSFQNQAPIRPAIATLVHPRASLPRRVGTDFELRCMEGFLIPPRSRGTVSVGFTLRLPVGIRAFGRTPWAMAVAGIDVCAVDVSAGKLVLANHSDAPFVGCDGMPVGYLGFDRTNVDLDIVGG